MTVRTRFAPSPTGYLHIGGAWTALLSWMYARSHGGQFILRIEDTDTRRTVEGARENLMEGLRWFGINWDEGPDIGGDFGPYVQTERQAIYQEWATWLVEHDFAYKCFATPEELDEMRKALEAKGDRSGYDRRYRDFPKEEAARLEAEGKPYVIRFKMPLDGKTVVPDLLRGDVEFDNQQFTDYVILKTSGLPTYHLASVVDDHLMQISHVTRGVEWLNTAPIHVRLYEALGWDMPVLVHLPVILNPNGKGKLSKRTQAFTESGEEILVKASEFRDAGYLQEVMVNFLSNIGWTFGDDVEIFSMADALARFDIADVSPAPTKLPYSKLDWLGNQYIQRLDDDELVARLQPFLKDSGMMIEDAALKWLAPAVKVRLRKLTDAADMLQYMVAETPLNLLPEKLVHKKMSQPSALAAFTAGRDFVAGLTDETFTSEELSTQLRAIGEAHTENGKAGPFLGTMRYAITAQQVSPPLFESILALGREETIARLDDAIRHLSE